MLASRRRSTPLLLSFALVALVLLYHSSNPDNSAQWRAPFKSHALNLAANRTLGFGAVVAVSKEGSPRRYALLQAANVTDFDITIPTQPSWTEGDIERFSNGKGPSPHRGSLLAWMGHHNALRWFLNSGLDTVLILEDDVDWDIRLRSLQIPLAAKAVRQLLPPVRSHHPVTNFRNSHMQYWGDHDAWDLLYLGHCGDYFGPLAHDGPNSSRHSFNLTGESHVVYEDPTLPPLDELHPFTKKLFEFLGLPGKSRVMHRSKSPLCSFGYAVTRSAAMQLLDDLTKPKDPEKGPHAYDVALLEACRDHNPDLSPTPTAAPALPPPTPEPTPKGLRCWTLNSELFHHMPGPSQIDEISLESGHTHGLPPVDQAALEQVALRGETSNIDCGFWGGAFAFNDGDLEQLKKLQDQVGRQGKCLKKGQQSMDSAMEALIE